MTLPSERTTPYGLAARCRRRGNDVRYDVVYGGDISVPTCYVRPHYCRDWDESGGCYGTNEAHGMAWKDARAAVADWYEARSILWRHKDEDESGYVQDDTALAAKEKL